MDFYLFCQKEILYLNIFFFPFGETAMGSNCSDSLLSLPSNPPCPQISMETHISIILGLGGSDWGMSRMLTVNPQPGQTYGSRRVLSLVVTDSGPGTTGRATARVPVPIPGRVCPNSQRICRFRGLALGGSRCLRTAGPPLSNGRGGSGGGNAQKERNEAGI